ncbi:MAG: DUF6077 domain-containing protein [Eubacteriales bacterium]|nr:DUF6077 domain-containing protein [Eubacteriales bacterium]
MRLEILLTALLFFGGTILSGYALRRVLKLQGEGFLFSAVSGTMLWWALMEVILVPMTMRFASFQSFVYLYGAAVLLLCVAGLFCWKDIVEDARLFCADWKKYVTPGHVVALALIAYQLWFIHHHMYLEWDDTYYVNLANEAVYSDKIYWVYPETGAMADFDKRYVLSLWPIFYAWLSKLIGVIPTIMAHTILPWLMIPLAYMVYGLLGRRLFPKDAGLRGMFLAFAVMMHLFMSGEHTAGLTFLSITPWVGKGLLATVLIPMLLFCVLRTADGQGQAGKSGSFGDWLLLGITGLGGCLLSSMGIMLSPLFVGAAVFLAAVQKRSVPYLLKGAAACVPCVLLGIYYIYLTR